MQLFRIQLGPWSLPFLMLGLGLALTACQEDEDPVAPDLENDPPVIRRIDPQQMSVNDTAGAVVTITHAIADNEWLEEFIIVEERDTLRDTLIQQTFPSGYTGEDRSYNYQIDPAATRGTEFRLWFYVLDNIGQKDSAQFIITVINPDSVSEPYPIQTYTGDTLYNGQSLINKAAFNFLQRAHVTGPGSAAKDVEETTNAVDEFERNLRSPNNENNGKFNRFVLLDSTTFNYNQAVYTVIDQAWKSNPQLNETGRLEVGDIVILRLNFEPHYAVMRITDIRDDGPNGDDDDFIVFDYKLSIQQ